MVSNNSCSDGVSGGSNFHCNELEGVPASVTLTDGSDCSASANSSTPEFTTDTADAGVEKFAFEKLTVGGLDVVYPAPSVTMFTPVTVAFSCALIVSMLGSSIIISGCAV